MTRINVMKPWLGDDEAWAVQEVIRSGWVAQGPRVAEFERAFAASVGAAYGVALSSCTTALHLALVVADVPGGCDVVVPSFSFIATANAATYVGARPVFADVEPETGNLTASTVEAALTADTRAVIAVDQGGAGRHRRHPAGVRPSRGDRGRGRGMRGGLDVPRWPGRHWLRCRGVVVPPRKLLTTGEGGMLTTDNPDWAARARRLREHGMNVSAADRHASTLPVAEQYLERGFNYRMTDLQAAVGLVQLAKLPAMVARRRDIATSYARAFADVPGLRCVADPAHGAGNFQSYWVEIGPAFPVDREGLLAHLAHRDISARRGIMSTHRQPAYEGYGHGSLTVTERLTDCTLILPIYHEMTADEADRVIDAVLEAAGRGR